MAIFVGRLPMSPTLTGLIHPAVCKCTRLVSSSPQTSYSSSFSSVVWIRGKCPNKHRLALWVSGGSPRRLRPEGSGHSGGRKRGRKRRSARICIIQQISHLHPAASFSFRNHHLPQPMVNAEGIKFYWNRDKEPVRTEKLWSLPTHRIWCPSSRFRSI